ncbi:protein-(glutamine-N5) methyltransferase, release factor-specific [Paenibacillus curdlanolyticus YK9]|uniref:Release factor glutamine methyltransferase n=1 Tax=Paenibacillus curdlanolyticus YK9 TaxID=717606 RepID=E0IEL8_9BACL|nr:HemK/PrmC family methyltransferase [Paenibacillus curdlanolyticus]EFM09106.1 protein-(glutamine-N5) methyltransferase, release factor-specific [Paenibacillus curdlanolyticus YK9]
MTNMETGTNESVAYRPGMTIGEACLQASSLLAGHGIGEPRSNAELLIGHVLGFGKAELLRDWREPMPEEAFARWAKLVARKAAGEPVQYLLGEQWFYGRPFAVTAAVLIPRPETELLVEAVLAEADALWPRGEAAAAGQEARVRELTVLDVGTGSGAIAVTLAAERSDWRVYASDLSPDALQVALGNAWRHAGAGRIAFVEGDLLTPFLAVPETEADRASAGRKPSPAADASSVSAVDTDGEHRDLEHSDADQRNAHRTSHLTQAAGLRIDVLVSNPPYIPAGDLPDLQTEVRDYEPRLALDGGMDGLDPYRRMAEQLLRLAELPRIVAFELGMGQAEDVAELLRSIGYWDHIRIITDYGGIDRHVVAVKRASGGSH